MAKETAESKLLKIIESTEAAQAAPAPSQPAPQAETAQATAASVKSSGLPSIDFASIPQAIIGFLTGRQSSPQSTPFGLKEFNRILIVLIILSAFLFARSFMSGMEFSKREVDVKISVPKRQPGQKVLLEPKMVADYLSEIMRRNIFQPYEKKIIVQEAETGPKIPVMQITEKVKDLKLVGISWLDSVESASALIENTTTGVTYFLRTGEKINSVTVKVIYADAVILGFEGEELEMRL